MNFVSPESWQPQPVPAAFADKLRPEPPLATGVLGEAGLLVWIAQGKDIGDFMSEAEGWRGDRFAFWADGTLLMRTNWLDEDEAAEFAEAIKDRPGVLTIIATDRRTVHVILTPSRESSRQLAQTLGQP